MPEQTGVREQFAYSCIFSPVDLKSGFHNLPVDSDSSDLLGFIT